MLGLSLSGSTALIPYSFGGMCPYSVELRDTLYTVHPLPEHS